MSRCLRNNAKNTLSMKSSKVLILLALALVVCVPDAVAQGGAGDLGLLPLPRKVELTGGEFCYTPEATLYTPNDTLAHYLADYFEVQNTIGPSTAIMVGINPSLDLPAEGYTIDVRPEGVWVSGVDYGGAFCGVQTLLQLFPPEVYKGAFRSECTIPCLRLTDWPEYSYRGMHFDVARTFSPFEELLRYVDNLSRHKINTLHLHLVDDEGWRIEILSHPELTEVGAWRGGEGNPLHSVYGRWGERYGGYYTQEQMRQLVAYAAVRNIVVVPEIDLPGHSLAIAKAHPEILCPVEKDLTRTAGYDTSNVWCVAREENYALLEDIFAELVEIFPSEYIHIGGDEVQMGSWRKCPHCSALYKAQGYTDYHQLEAHFLNRVVEILGRYGRKPAVWNEAANGGNLTPTARVHGWEAGRKAARSAERGFRTVVMSGPYFYFDMRQSDDEPGHNWAGVVTTQKCYSYRLAEQGFSKAAQANVEGFSGAFWTELLVVHGEQNPHYIDYQLYPRVCALAEVGWTDEPRRQWGDFESRLEGHHLARLEAMGIHYRQGEPPQPEGKVVCPKMECRTSLPMRNEGDLAKLSAWANDYGARAKRTCREGDWIEYRFAEPLPMGAVVELTTGYRHVTRGLFPSGVVEVSGDGADFSSAGTLYNGRATLTIDTPTKSIRIRCTTTGNGDPYVFVQQPVVRVEKL